MITRTFKIDKQGKPTPKELIVVRGTAVRFDSASDSDLELHFKTVPSGGWLTVAGAIVTQGHKEPLTARGQSRLFKVDTTPGNFDPPEPDKKPRKTIKVDVNKAKVKAAAGADPDIIIEEC